MKPYKFRMKNGEWVDAFEGMSICVVCKKEFKLDTTDNTLFNKIRCFPCYIKL